MILWLGYVTWDPKKELHCQVQVASPVSAPNLSWLVRVMLKSHFALRLFTLTLLPVPAPSLQDGVRGA